MSKQFVVHTQVIENYGAHAENGKHEDGNAYWKFKGGDTYVVENAERVQDAVAAVMAYVSNDISWKEFPVKWESYASWWHELITHNDQASTQRELDRVITIDVDNPAGEQYMNCTDPWEWDF